VSRAAKGADCKSAGLAFVGSSPTSPTTSKTRLKLQACFFSRAAPCCVAASCAIAARQSTALFVFLAAVTWNRGRIAAILLDLNTEPWLAYNTDYARAKRLRTIYSDKNFSLPGFTAPTGSWRDHIVSRRLCDRDLAPFRPVLPGDRLVWTLVAKCCGAGCRQRRAHCRIPRSYEEESRAKFWLCVSGPAILAAVEQWAPNSTRELYFDEIICMAVFGALGLAMGIIHGRRFDLYRIVRSGFSGGAGFPPSLLLILVPVSPKANQLFAVGSLNPYLMFAGATGALLIVYGVFKR
jgi:hypothetical protein